MAQFRNKEEYEKWKAETLAKSKNPMPEGKGGNLLEQEKQRAEKKCPFCAMPIPSEAKTCPHCRKSQPTKAMAGIVFATIFFFILIFVIGSLKGNSAKSSSSYKPGETEACVYSREMVKAFLKAPSTADFPSDACNAKSEGDTVRISSYVDAQNNFGAKLRTPCAWIGSYDPASKKWKVDYFAMGDKIIMADGKLASP